MPGENKRVFIPPELYAKLAEHAEQKNVTVDQEVHELIQLGIHTVGMFVSAKSFMKGGETEL